MRPTRIWQKSHVSAVYLALTWGFCVLAISPPATSAAPPDLQLSAVTVDHSDSLAHFAAGLLLAWEDSKQPQRSWEHFAKSLLLQADAKIVLQQLATPLIVTEQHARLADYLLPAAQAHPQATLLQIICSQALVHAGRGEQAVELLTAAITSSKWRNAPLLRQLVLTHQQLKQHDKIEALLSRAAKVLRGNFVYEQIAAIHAGDKLLRAIAADTAAATDDAAADNTDAAAAAAEQQQQQRLSARQQRRLHRAVRQHSRRAIAGFTADDDSADAGKLAALLMNLQDWQLAGELLSQVRQHYGSDAPSELSLQLAECLQQQQRHTEAIAILRQLDAAVAQQPLLYVELGRRYLAGERYRDAAAAFEVAVMIHPNSLRLRLTLAYIYEALGEAQRVLELLAATQPQVPEILLLRSHAYYALGKLPAAAKAIGEAEALARKQENSRIFSVHFYLYYATVCEQMGYIDRALEVAHQALALEPDSHVAANFIGYVMADHHRDLAVAEKLIDQALAAKPESVAYLDSRAWVYYRQGRMFEAMQVMQHVLRLLDEAEADAVIFDHAGDIYAANNQMLLAQRYWWEALVRGAANAEAIKAKLQSAAQSSSSSAI